MLKYFILFAVIGFIIGKFNSENEKQALGIIVIIAIIWGATYAPIWGLMSLAEMALGYMITKIFNSKKD